MSKNEHLEEALQLSLLVAKQVDDDSKRVLARLILANLKEYLKPGF